MFAVVSLQDINNKNIVVPMKWINNYNISDSANNGINSCVVIVFYVQNLNTKANFLCPVVIVV